jgi:membrane-associated protease RseP (regulator of RpoE activity)
MPTSACSSIDSQPPFAKALPKTDPPPPLAPLKWRWPVVLFAATVISILYSGAMYGSEPGRPLRLSDGVTFTAALLGILLTHELAHFFFARLHRVNASLPMFLPLPVLSPVGTAGAIIVMPDRIRSRNALLDVGASGPLAGLAVAIPVLLVGLSHSSVQVVSGHGFQEGQCLLYSALKRIALGPIPDGSDVFLSPVAFAGWVGLLITMLNLLPVGQLDGGHIAYALLGPRQNRYGRWVRWAVLALSPIDFLLILAPWRNPSAVGERLGSAISGSVTWLAWFVILTILLRLSGGGHPPTEPGELSRGRRVVAIGTLVLFVLLVMPIPMMEY